MHSKEMLVCIHLDKSTMNRDQLGSQANNMD